MDCSGPIPAPTQLLDPEGRAAYLKLVNEPQYFRGEPGTISLWFVSLCLLVPYVLGGWYWFREIRQGIEDPLKWMGLVIYCLAGPGALTILYLVNRHFRRRGAFFVLDKQSETLSLPRQQIVLEKSRIIQFVRLSGWHKIQGERIRVHELCVLIDDETPRYLPVAIDNSKRYVARAGERLAEFFAVPLSAIEV